MTTKRSLQGMQSLAICQPTAFLLSIGPYVLRMDEFTQSDHFRILQNQKYNIIIAAAIISR